MVAVHTVGLTGLYFGHGAPFGDVDNGLVTLLHFTRETFMFLTGLVLFYQYRDRNATTREFWGRRFPPTLIPYIAWSMYYTLSADIPAGENWGLILSHMGRGLLFGTASYHLYYMIITFQFYLVFPLILVFLKRRPEWSTWALLVSAAVTLAWYAFLGASNVDPKAALWPWGAKLQSHFFVPYLFYFVLGSWVALHLEAVVSYLKAHVPLVLTVAIAMVALLEVHYALSLLVWHERMGSAVTVLQPITVPYTVGVILFLFLFAFALEKESPIRRFLRRLTAGFADISFGVYLCHVAFLAFFLRTVDPWLGWPAWELILVSWPVVMILSAALTLLLRRFRLTAIFVGLRSPVRRKDGRAAVRREATT